MEISDRIIESRLIDSVIEDAMNDEGWRDGRRKIQRRDFFLSLSLSLSLPLSLPPWPRRVYILNTAGNSQHTPRLFVGEGKTRFMLSFFALHFFSSSFFSSFFFLFLFPFPYSVSSSGPRKMEKSAHAYCTGERIGEGFNYFVVVRL